MLRRVPSIIDSPRKNTPLDSSLRGTVYIVKDGEGIAVILSSILSEFGGTIRVISTPEEIQDDATAVISLAAIRDHQNFNSALESSKDAFRVAVRVAPIFESRPGLFVLVQDTGGNFGFDGWCEATKSPLGGIAGLAKTAAREWGKSTARVIDLDAGHRSPHTLAEELFQEIAYGNGIEVGLPEGGRTTIQLKEMDVADSEFEPRIGQTDVVVVTGGARGVTAECVIALAKESRARFALLGRSPLIDETDETRDATTDAELKRALMKTALESGQAVTPRELSKNATRILNSREIRETLSRVKAFGGDAIYIPTDITDVDALYEAIEDVRNTYGPITALIHGAGVLADRKIIDKTEDDFDFVVNTKVAGFYALSVVTNADPVHTILLFSSVAGRFGNVGQADYAMANEMLNKMAHVERKSRVDCLVKSLAWGPWDGGMVTPGIRAQFEAQGIQMIPLDSGAQQCVNEFNQSLSDAPIEVVLGDGFPFESREQTEFLVSTSRMKWLEDHSIEGAAVLPMVCAIDWMGMNDSNVVSLSDVSVRRAVRLDRDDELRITVDSDGDAVSLMTGDEATYVAKRVAALPKPENKKRPSREKWDGSVYDGDVLFHGPEFYFLKDVDTPSASDWWASVEGRDSRDWSSEFTIDIPAMDAALQMAVIWSSAQTDGRVAPMACQALTVWNDVQPKHAHLVARNTASSYAVCDVHLYDDEGSPAAVFLGVKCVKFASR